MIFYMEILLLALLVILVLILTYLFLNQRKHHSQTLLRIQEIIQNIARGEMREMEWEGMGGGTKEVVSSIIDTVREVSHERMEGQRRLNELERSEKAVLNLLEDMDEAKREMERLSVTDDLTGLYNRRALYQALEEGKKRAEEGGEPFSLIVMDVDNFKRYNDQHGHVEGDKALQEIAKGIKEAIRRDGDRAFRMGGDEFAIVLPGATQRVALQVGRRIKDHLKKRMKGKFLISLGVAQYKKGMEITDLIREADRMMYAEKREKEGDGSKAALPH